MIELPPITVPEYIDLLNESEQKAYPYSFAMKYAIKFTDPKDEYHIGDIMELPFGFIKDFQFDWESEQGMSFIKLTEYVLKITKLETLKDEPLDKFCRFSRYLIEGIKHIIEVEEVALAYDATDKEYSAGIDRFKDLGIYLQIRSLTGGDVTKYEQIRALPYSLCFTEMFTAKQLKEYEIELSKKR